MELLKQYVKEITCHLTQFTSKEGVTFNKLDFEIDGTPIATKFIDGDGALKLVLKNLGYTLYEKPKDN